MVRSVTLMRDTGRTGGSLLLRGFCTTAVVVFKRTLPSSVGGRTGTGSTAARRMLVDVGCWSMLGTNIPVHARGSNHFRHVSWRISGWQRGTPGQASRPAEPVAF